MTSPTPILIVDDDAGITALLSDYLTPFNFKVHCAEDGHAMRRQLAAHPIALVVLDLMLPGDDGMVLAREVRERSRLPIIMLTARSNPYDRVLGLEIGADDYVSKPFEPRELVARIQSVLRRVGEAQGGCVVDEASQVIHFDGWELHRHERRLTSPSGMVVPLSNAEYRLLFTFLQKPQRLFSRDQLMDEARGRGMEAFERSIDLLVSRLRQKLADNPRDPSMIKTIRGAGYLFSAQTVQGRAAWSQ